MKADTQTYHCGNAILINGHAVFITGEAGVGKSSLSLQLIERGHSLIADDMVKVNHCAGKSYLQLCEGPAFYMEVRGLGILNISSLFGSQATARKGRCRLIVNLINNFRLENRLMPFELSDAEGLQGIPVLNLDAKSSAVLPLYIETALKHICLTMDVEKHDYENSMEILNSLSPGFDPIQKIKAVSFPDYNLSSRLTTEK